MMHPNYYLRTVKDPILRTVCEPIKDFSELEEIVFSMREIISEYPHAVGIAAPQIGENKRVILAKLDTKFQVIVNPEIILAKGYIPFIEGCLSFPGTSAIKIRRYSIGVKYQDIEGQYRIENFKGKNSVILQHEIDHLNGKNIINPEYYVPPK